MAQQRKYVNGSNLLVGLGGKAFGHCTTHTSTFTTETTDTKVKPPKSQAASSSGLWKGKRVTGLAVQVKCDGLQFHNEAETGFKDLLAVWKEGGVVELVLFEREHDETPYCSGNFVITTLENTAPAGADATYSATLDNDGEVAVDPTKIDLLSANE